jgi:hypothetical protein
LKILYFICICLVFSAAIALAQSSPVTFAKHPSGAAPATNFGRSARLPQQIGFAQKMAKAAKRASSQSFTSQASGLNFAAAIGYDSGGSPNSAVVADVNGDGKLDLIVANYYSESQCGPNGSVGVLLGNGDGTFQTAVCYSSGGIEPTSVAVADVNGDGKPDMLVANVCAGSNCSMFGGDGAIGVLLGNGDGTFQAAVTYSSGGGDATSVAVADVNGDGKLDLLVANSCDTSGNSCNNDPPPDGSVSVLLGNGDGTFQPAVSYDSGGKKTISMAVADINGDGRPDLLVANQCAATSSSCYASLPGSADVLLGNGDGTFQAAVTYSSSGEAMSVAVADVNGDGKPDLLLANCCALLDVDVFLGNGNGTFQTAVSYYSGGDDASAIAVGDVNGDGKPDLLVLSSETSPLITGLIGVLLGNGDGTFQPGVTFYSNSPGGFPGGSVAAADLNGDGKPDVVVANPYYSRGLMNGIMGVLINTSTTATKTALVSSLNPSNFGQAVTFTATATAQAGFSKGTPTGTVTFFDGTTNIGNANLNGGGVASLMISTLAAGGHSITATYNGDTNFASSTSAVVSQEVQGVVLSRTSLDFGSQAVGVTSTPQSVMLVNSGSAVLTISSIGITGADKGEFSQTNNCPASLAANGSCTIGVTFTPTALGNASAAVSVTDSAAGSPQMVILAGIGTVNSFAIAPAPGSPTSAEVTPGNGASFTLTLTPSGPFHGTVNLACSVGPVVMRGPTCTVPTTVQVVAGTPANVPLSVNTTAPTTAGTVAPVNLPPGATRIAWTVFLFLSVFSLVVNRRRWPALAAPVLALAFISLAGCGGSGPSSSSSGTPLNTYTVTVTASSGSLASKTTVTVRVQ